VIPDGSNPLTQLVLWNERAEDGKLWPHRAIRHAGSHAEDLGDGAGPLGNWNDENDDGIDDLGFVCIGMTDYRVMLRYAEFDPVGVSRAGGGEFDAPSEPYQVGESAIVEGLRAADVPGGCHVHIVQFWTQPLSEFRAAIEGAGATIYNFLAGNSYIVRLPDAEAVESIQRLTCVRWVGEYHPAYRLDQTLLAMNFSPERPPPNAEPVRYNIMVHQSGLTQKNSVAERIRASGGEVHPFDEYGVLLWATLDVPQLAVVLRMNELSFVDLWGLPESTMDFAREISGANYVNDGQGMPLRHFRGQGVRGEVMDGAIFADVPQPPGLPVTHEALDRPLPSPTPPSPFTGVVRHGNEVGTPQRGHGTACYGIVFGTGEGQVNARGMLYDEGAVGIFATHRRLLPSRGTVSRDLHVEQLVDPAGPYRAVFQSNSFGTSPSSTQYTSFTHEIDDIAFKRDILICNSQGNSANQLAAQQAWAKDIVSVGGIKHQSTLDRSDDRWGGCFHTKEWQAQSDPFLYRCDEERLCDTACPSCNPKCGPDAACVPGTPGAASVGPAADGRIKPDLVHFYSEVFTTWFRPNSPVEEPWYYACGFEGTSCATPIVAGCFGLFFQMWHEQVFQGFGGATDVFASKSHMTTAKAMLINTAYRYAWNSPPPEVPNPDLTRHRQGWGMPDLRELYEARNNMLIIDETDVLTYVGQTMVYAVSTLGVGKPLRATMVYADPGGTVSSSQHRINDISLTVISPSGATYYGNNGLTARNRSASGGGKDTKNTVENVFIQSPASGAWIIKVQLVEQNEDGNYSTPFVDDADFALVVSGVQPLGSSVAGDWNSDGDIDSTDFMAFLAAFLQGEADVDADGVTTTKDFLEFVGAFLAGKR
jgi:serine protease AprX